MRIQKLLVRILFTIAITSVVFAQAPNAPSSNPKDKLFGAKTPREDDPNGRILQGAVTKEDGSFVEGAVVRIKNLKSANERSFITKKDGTYRFDGLLKDVDYEMSASYKGAVSDTKKLSMYDSRKQVARNFVIPEKVEKAGTPK
jgi:hypothetical protein